MATCRPFKGPITATALIQWVESCEGAFQVAAFTKGSVPDNLKVISAGSAIDPEAERLFEWWSSRQDALAQLSWDKFVDKMTSWALGPGWKFTALEAFAHIEQGEDTVEQYTTKLRAANLVLKRAGIQISDFHYKFQLLFHASPVISTLVKTTPNFEFSRVSIEALEERMELAANGIEGGKGKQREPSGPLGSTSDTPPPYIGTGTSKWEFSEQWGYEAAGSIPFTQISFLPPHPDKSGRVVSVSLSADNALRGLKTLMRSDETNATWTLDTHTNSHPTFQDISIDAGDYVNYVMFTRTASSAICSARIETSRGKSLTGGDVQTAETKFFRAKRGQRIVGFHGTLHSEKTYIWKVGVIYAPLLPTEKET